MKTSCRCGHTLMGPENIKLPHKKWQACHRDKDESVEENVCMSVLEDRGWDRL